MEGLFYKKNILIVSEAYTYGGLETHLQGEVRQLKQYGMNVIVATGVYNETIYDIGADKIYTNLNFDFISKPDDFEAISKEIQEIIIQEKIDIVHAHPYMSIPTSYHACIKTGTPFIYTLHGPSSVHNSYGKHFTELMAYIIDKISPIVVSAELANVVSEEYPESKPVVCVNSVQFLEKYVVTKYNTLRKPKRVLIVSRIDDQKVVGIMRFLEMLGSYRRGDYLVDIAGDGPFLEQLKRWLIQNNLDFVSVKGAIVDANEIMSHYDLIGGMGRVVLEAIASQIPVCLIGYDGVKGPLQTLNQFRKASFANFSGRNMPNITTIELRNQLDSPSTYSINTQIYGFARENYNEDFVWRRLFATIQPLDTTTDQRYLSLVKKY